MSYVDEVLTKDEHIRYTAKVSLVSYLFNFLLGAILLVSTLPMLVMTFFVSEGGSARGGVFFWLVVALLLLLWPFIARMSTELVLTNRRVIAKFGVISRDT